MNDTPSRLSIALADRYRIERELGAGGMATVYLAHDIKHDRDVAIKVLHPDLGAALGGERFLTEIRTTARLQHPHILPLLDSGDAGDGLLYYVMPFVAGETLRARLQREQQLAVGDAVLIAREVADALQYAHAQGVIHRDIKPENILLQGGHALVADFGIALAVQSAGGARMTQTGLSLGTPSYMSPEQAMGERAIGARSDIYALGAITYEMLVGEPPFTGATMQAIVAKVISAEPERPSLIRKTLPPSVERAVLKALAKLPADRFASAAEFSSAVADTSGRADASVNDSGRKPSAVFRMVPWVVGIAVGAALGVAAFSALRGGATNAALAAERFVIATPDSVELQVVCCGQMFALTPDGRTLVFQARAAVQDTAKQSPSYTLYARNLSELTARPIPGTENAQSISFSPDGKQIAFFVGQRLMRVPLAGGTPTEIAILPRGFVGGSTWISNDRIAAAVGAGIYEANANADSANLMLPVTTESAQATGPSYVADGNALLFAYVSMGSSPRVQWLKVGNKAPKPLMLGATPVYVPAWRKLVVARGVQLFAYPFNPATGDTTGAGVRIADNIVMRSPVVAHAEYAVASNGTLVITHREIDKVPSKLTLVTGTTTVPLSLPEKEIIVDHPRFSPDSKRIVVQSSDDAYVRSLYVWNIDRALSQRVTEDQDAVFPSWVGRGDSIAYYAAVAGVFKIIHADGSGPGRVLGKPEKWALTTNFAINGSWLAIEGKQASASASSDIVVFNRDSGGAVRPFAATSAEETDPAISPDGKWLAFTSDETGRQEVFVSPFPNPTAKYPVSSNGGRLPMWSGDSKTLSFDAPNDGFTSIPFTAGAQPSFGKSRVVYRRPFVRNWTISPDGANILFVDTVRLLKLLGFEIVLHLQP